ncbi:DUF4912 domain-containing protein [Corallococcus silvisoli]|uniref:DUF4912 domain-containing protein n=1 Tax=Corallococcus silvisoli TaxID=2697031 RepID=UPI001378DE22|nr:DUF4912 domain-containing protein [Corallococcus silvisoli]NBD10938.1 DUF4912 domain-containing protein [Corallococcus silvisoli]
MDERKGVTVSYLRELARKYLRQGSGTSRGREFVASLAERIPALGRLARMAGLGTSQRGSGDVKGEARTLDSRREDSGPVHAAPAESVPLPPAEASGSHARELSEEPITQPSGGPRTQPARVVTFPAREKARRDPDDEDTLSLGPEVATPRPSSARDGVAPDAPASPASEPPHAAEPLVEGFFVTRMAGPDEARRHHLLEEQSPRLPPADASPEREEHLGVLPLDYQDDAMVLLARDPHTLFAFWDFSDATRGRALDGLPSPRAVLKVFDGEGVSREVDFALESRSFYLQGLSPGRTYRVEAHFVGADGRSRRIGQSSNRATLPPAGPSEDTSIRFLRMPPPVEERQHAEAGPEAASTRVPGVQEREYVTWRRVSLPGSGGVMDVPEVHRERTEAYVDAPRVPGASDQRYAEADHLDVPRAPGASDQRYEAVARMGETKLGGGEVLAPSRAPGASDQRYLSVERVPGASDQLAGAPARHPYLEVARATGASEQRYGQTLLPGGVSAYRYLEVPRAAGASEQRYVEGRGAQAYLDVPRAPGASDQRYLTVSAVPGASDRQYLEVPRAPGASDQRYLTVPRAVGASEQRYPSVDRAVGALDQQYQAVPLVTGASDQQSLSVERATGASGTPSAPRAPESASSSQGEALEARDLPLARPVPVSGAEARSPGPASAPEPEAPRDPWALSIARGPTASEQRALDKAREAAEAARRAPPAPGSSSAAPARSEAPVAPSAAPVKEAAPTTAKSSAPPEPPKNPPEPSSPGSKSSSRSRSSRRGRK